MWRFAPARPLGLAALAIAAALGVLLLGLEGSFSRIVAGGPGAAMVPGLTVADDEPGSAAVDASARTGPVITSLRSGSAAARAGVQVGDRISGVDGHPVRDLAGLRAALAAAPDGRTLALHIRRGRAIWTVALDRAEPVRGAGHWGGPGHEPQDPAD